MNITQPKGFITNTSPLIEWSSVDGVTEYQLSVTDNVTSEVVIDQTITDATSYQLAQPLPLGTYLIKVQAEGNIATETVIITNTIAQYLIVGREGDTNYTAYKAYQMSIRQQAKQAGQAALSTLRTNAIITQLLTESGDADLAKYHADTINQTPGLASDFTEILTLFSQVVTVMRRINLRDPQF